LSWQQGRSEVNFDDTVKFPNLRNPVLCKDHASMPYVSRVIAIFVTKFITVATGVSQK